MANEIQLRTDLRVTNGAFTFNRSSNIRVDQTDPGGGGPGTVKVGTVEESIDMSDYGFVQLRNLDATNFVQLGFSAGDYNIRLRPNGLPLLVELEAAQTIFVKADTAECNVDIVGFFA